MYGALEVALSSLPISSWIIVGEVREQIGDRRIDGDLADRFGQPVLAARLEQALGEDVGIFLPVVAGAW